MAEAEYDLVSAANQSCSSGYELDQLLRLLAYAFSHQQKYPEAIEAYKKIVVDPDYVYPDVNGNNNYWRAQ